MVNLHSYEMCTLNLICPEYAKEDCVNIKQSDEIHTICNALFVNQIYLMLQHLCPASTR